MCWHHEGDLHSTDSWSLCRRWWPWALWPLLCFASNHRLHQSSTSLLHVSHTRMGQGKKAKGVKAANRFKQVNGITHGNCLRKMPVEMLKLEFLPENIEYAMAVLPMSFVFLICVLSSFLFAFASSFSFFFAFPFLFLPSFLRFVSFYSVFLLWFSSSLRGRTLSQRLCRGRAESRPPCKRDLDHP